MLSDLQLKTVSDLVLKYDALPERERRRYQETEVRTNFIDPLFAAVGWPMDDRSHVERETTVQESKRPDYLFKLNGVPHLFLEAKRFSEDVHSLQWATDAITKAYNKGVGWAGVTNFTNLVIYDAYELLSPSSHPRTVLDLSYERYPDHQSLLYELSPAALEERVMEKRAQETGIRTKTITIEKRLYQSMRDWREKLINDMARYQNWQTEEQYAIADEAVQRLIDRLLFLRHCEDRGISEPDLRSLLHRMEGRTNRHVRVTDSLLRLFARAAETFDSEIFQTDALIDVQFRALAGITDFDDALAEIIRGLYHVPLSLAEYDFSQMDADILGQVYEQYLGHVAQQARKFADTQATLPGMPLPAITVDAKRQRRRERGIYYTPTWVVRYIVEQTVGRFLEENRHNADAIDNVAILDPACGSGSFLIRAYETLLEHHAQRMGGDIGHLDTRTRERILGRNIFGVDLDAQAVEIARLNLLIRMVRQQERLPELQENIQMGNSLIEGDEAVLRPFFADGWEEKHPFNWAQRFPQVMERGGFDIIMGNPPYVRIQTLPRDEVAYFNEKYEAATGSYDIYCLFVERGLQLLRPGGLLGFIIPNKFMQASYGKGLRSLLAENRAVSKIVDFGDAQIFESGTNYTCLLFLAKGRGRAVTYVPAKQEVPQAPQAPAIAKLDSVSFDSPVTELSPKPWVFMAGLPAELKQKLDRVPHRLAGISDSVFQGLKTGADKVFVLDLVSHDDALITVYSRARKQRYQLERDLLKPLIKGHEMKRFCIESPKRMVLFPYRVAKLIPEQEIQSTYPAIWAYLAANRNALESREKGRWRGPSWFGYSRIQNLDKFDRPKIVTPDVASATRYSLDQDGHYYFSGGGAGGYGIALKPGPSPEFVLGLLNSKLLDWYLRKISSPFRGGYYSYESRFISQLPIRIPASRSDKKVHVHLVALVQRMLDLHQRLAAKGDVRDYEREQIEREIASTDREIDNLVYDLYGLTAAERALVESEVRR